MNSKTPNQSFDIPEENTQNISQRKNTGFNINSIPRFHNPNVNTDKPRETLKDKLSEIKNQQIHTEDSSGPHKSNIMPEEHKPETNENSKKEKARAKLAKMRAHKHFATIRFAIISFIVFLLIFNSQIIYSQGLYLYSKSPFAPKTQTALIPSTPTNIPSQSAQVVGPENIIIIPKLNVSAPLVFPETIEEKAVLRALQDGVVHYSGTANPGENGNAVFFGHSSNDVWEKGNYKFVFVLLEKLVVGDQYEIHYQSRKYIYTVEETKIVAPNELSVLNQTSIPYSTLITCTPPGTNWRRFIVKAKQVEPIPSAPQTQVTQTQVQQNQQISTLPSAAPTIIDQIRILFTNLINKILGRESVDQTQPTNQPTQPTNHLPEVSSTDSMPTIF